MKIAIGSDHAGINLKKEIQEHYSDIEFKDVGTHSAESCDYPDYAGQVGKLVARGNVDLGIAICGSGIGASITVNKIKGIRGALCFNGYMAEMAKRHNNANVIVLGARVIGTDIAFRIIDNWLGAEYEGGRHQRRLDKISGLEEASGE